jgi:hypothetical protein
MPGRQIVTKTAISTSLTFHVRMVCLWFVSNQLKIPVRLSAI